VAVVALALGTAFAGASSAQAGTLVRTVTGEPPFISTYITYTGAPGERNNVVFGSSDRITTEGATSPEAEPFVQPDAVIIDTDSPISGACLAVRPHVRYCSDYGVATGLESDISTNQYIFNLGDRDDQIQLRGDHAVSINAGDGNDRIFARNGATDHISCGPGTDLVIADTDYDHDYISGDCEIVNPPDTYLIDVTVNVAGRPVPVHAVRCSDVPQNAAGLPCPLLRLGR